MTTIANLLPTENLTKLHEIAGQADLPADQVIPTNLLDAVCEFCGTDLKVAPPIAGTISCKDCAKNRAVGKAGRRYVKATHRARIQATPAELARAARIDLSHLSEAEVGRLVRNGWLGVETRRIENTNTTKADEPTLKADQPKLKQPEPTAEQLVKAEALTRNTPMSLAEAIAYVTK